MSFRNSSLALTKRLSAATFIVAAVAGTCFEVSAAHAAVARGEQCSAFIETARPGVDVTVPYGPVYQSLAKARQDAFSRCSLTNLAEEGWGPCRTWCVPVDSRTTG
jgi:hypothetical protein